MPKKNYKKRKPRYKEEYDEEQRFWELSRDTRKGILVIVLFAFGIISVLGFFGMAGSVGAFIEWILKMALGSAFFIFPLILFLSAYFILRDKEHSFGGVGLFGLLIFVLSLNALLGLRFAPGEILSLADHGLGGGYFGIILAYPLVALMGFWASLVMLIAFLVIALLFIFNTSLYAIIEKFKNISRCKNIFSYFMHLFTSCDYCEADDDGEYEDEEDEEDEIGEEVEDDVAFERKDVEDNNVGNKKSKGILEQKEIKFQFKKRKASKADLPIELLNNKLSQPVSGNIGQTMECIAKTLDNFGISVEMGEVNVGPTVTQYTFKPADGIKLSRVVALNNDLSLALASHPIRIEAPIPGKSLVGIEVPNRTTAFVSLRAILESREFKNRKNNLSIGLGKDVAGKCWTIDITKMPHLLIAGATGSGKSVCINSLIVSLLYQNSADELKFIMVDPKRVELPIYNGIPHLLTPVITDVQKTVNALRWAIGEMDRRFDLLSKLHYRDIGSYNKEKDDKMPYIVIIVDELADLMATVAADVEAAIIRLAQMARAVGIHLILATQRPSVNVITGLIKANIPARIAFSVASLIDSRTILDTAGAEKLCGRGDMLLLTAQLGKPKRLQGTIVFDDEIKRIVDYLKKQEEPEYDDGIVKDNKSATSFIGFSNSRGDELLSEAKEIILRAGKASASLLQRRLKVGYARAARILDLLEEEGFIGPSDGAKPREVLADSLDEGIKDDDSDEYTEEEDIGENEE